ncbi:MAG: metal ABC transporter ATP-binding protein [Peptococcales bacterium]|jgi:zinc transport system ATP-binding protein
MNKSAVFLDNISFAYSGQNYILHNITLEIPSGQMVGIIGTNGAGKSTLIKIILGLVKPQIGQVYLQGSPLNQFNSWTKIGYLSQKATAFNTSFPASVEEVIAAPLNIRTLLPFMPKKIKVQVHEVLTLVGLEHYRKRLIGNLSGGQQQRVFLARTLVTQPEILILDEPFVGIDENSQKSIAQILSTLRQKGTTIIFVSHDLRWLKNDTDVILAVNEGKIKKYTSD